MNSSRIILVVTIGGLGPAAGAISDDKTPDTTARESAAGPFHEAVLKVAAEYKAWGRVDDEMRWAPMLCRPGAPGTVYLSASQNDETHGRKLYSLFARRREDYARLGKSRDPVAVGQVIVKQSWLPEEITEPSQRPDRKTDFDGHKVLRTPALQPDTKRKGADGGFDHFYPYAWQGDKAFKATRQADLFVMLKLDPETPDTDNGWVYATVTPDGKRVTAAGRIESCMGCHQDAKKDRLFGLGK